MPRFYDYEGNAIHVAGHSLKRNNSVLVDQFLDVARSYLNQSSISYQDGNTPFYSKSAISGIDCSTFVGFCLMGFPFSKTPYATRVQVDPTAFKPNTAEYDWAILPMAYKVSRYIDGSTPNETVKLACQMARWMENRGQVVPLSDGFADVLPGDIVFWGHKLKTTNDWYRADWFEHINHVGIILTKEDAPDTFEYVDAEGNTQTGTWDKSKYPYKHQIIDCGATTPPVRTTHWLEEGQEDPTNVYRNDVNSIAMICRPDLGTLSPPIE